MPWESIDFVAPNIVVDFYKIPNVLGLWSICRSLDLKTLEEIPPSSFLVTQIIPIIEENIFQIHCSNERCLSLIFMKRHYQFFLSPA